MKIKLSKSQWEAIGKTAGWMKKEATADVQNLISRFLNGSYKKSMFSNGYIDTNGINFMVDFCLKKILEQIDSTKNTSQFLPVYTFSLGGEYRCSIETLGNIPYHKTDKGHQELNKDDAIIEKASIIVYDKNSNFITINSKDKSVDIMDEKRCNKFIKYIKGT